MIRSTLLVFSLVLATFCTTSFAEDSTGTLEVVEVVVHNEDPVYVYVQDWAEAQLRSFKHEKLVAVYNKEKDKKETAIAKIDGIENFIKELRPSIKNGMSEIRGWDSINEEPIIIQCRSSNTRSKAKRFKRGDIINYSVKESFKFVSMRTVHRISWNRGRKNGVLTYIPKERDKLEWHWSIDGWGDEYVLRAFLSTAPKTKKYVFGNLTPSNLHAKTTPVIIEGVELSKRKNAPYGWTFAPPHHVYPWTTKQDLSSGITASLNKCLFDGRSSRCVTLNGDLDNLYSVRVQVFGFKDGGKGKRLTPHKGFVIGGAAGGVFGSSLRKHIPVAKEFPDYDKKYVRYEVEIIEILIYEN